MRRTVRLPISHHDSTADVVDQDRAAGLDLTTAPLMRLHIVTLPGLEEQAEAAAAPLAAAGLDVLIDDRDARAGEKFADADLIGCPLRVTVGRKAAEDGTVDLRERTKGEDSAVKVGELVSTAREKLD